MAMKAKIITGATIQTKKCRICYVHLFEKYDKSDKYQCRLLIPKDDKETLGVMKKAIESAKADGKTRLWGGKLPGSYRGPLNDGDSMEEPQPEYEGCYYLTAKSRFKPKVTDADGGEVFDEEEIYPGCYVRAIISFYPYNNDGKGVGPFIWAALEMEQLGYTTDN